MDGGLHSRCVCSVGVKEDTRWRDCFGQEELSWNGREAGAGHITHCRAVAGDANNPLGLPERRAFVRDEVNLLSLLNPETLADRLR